MGAYGYAGTGMVGKEKGRVRRECVCLGVVLGA